MSRSSQNDVSKESGKTCGLEECSSSNTCALCFDGVNSKWLRCFNC
jgi:hypothetical protein